MKRWGVVILIAALLSGCGSGQAEETKASVQEIVTSGGNSISAGNEAGKKQAMRQVKNQTRMTVMKRLPVRQRRW